MKRNSESKTGSDTIGSTSSKRARISGLVEEHRPDLAAFESIYRTLHADPELSLQEHITAAFVAKELGTMLGFEVKSGIGGTGVVGFLKNGHGKNVLLRSELDALPLPELTKLAYANPQQAAVVTVGAIHAGSTANVISDEAVLHINTRPFTADNRKHLKTAIERIIHAECAASGCTKLPSIVQTSTFPLLYKDNAATAELSTVMKHHFGHTFDSDAPVSMGSGDIANLAIPINAPVCFSSYGGTDQRVWDDAKREGRLETDIPGIHSSYFAPAIQPTLTTGMDCYAIAALSFMSLVAADQQSS